MAKSGRAGKSEDLKESSHYDWYNLTTLLIVVSEAETIELGWPD